MLNRHDLIEFIEGLYPADSEDCNTKKTGQLLLIEAISPDWRNLPVEMLVKYAELCSFREGETLL